MSLVQNTKTDREKNAALKKAVLEKERIEKQELKEKERAEKQALKEKEKEEKQQVKDNERLVKQAAKEAVKGAKIELPDKIILPETVVLIDKTKKENVQKKIPLMPRMDKVVRKFITEIRVVYEKSKDNVENWTVFEDVVLGMFNDDDTLNMEIVYMLDKKLEEVFDNNSNLQEEVIKENESDYEDDDQDEDENKK